MTFGAASPSANLAVRANAFMSFVPVIVNLDACFCNPIDFLN